MKKLRCITLLLGFNLSWLVVSGRAQNQPAAKRQPTEIERPVVAGKELLITDLNVVNADQAIYPGPWSFGTLCERLGSKICAPELVRQWLHTWVDDQSVNGASVEARADIYDQVIVPWQKRDHFDSSKGEPWQPNLAHAPFRLLAIVNRLDLAVGGQLKDLEQAAKPTVKRPVLVAAGVPTSLPAGFEGTVEPTQPTPSAYGGGGAPPAPPMLLAEGRFVFCVTDDTGNPLPGGFTVILEYALQNSKQYHSAHDWAAAWHALSEQQYFNSKYLKMLNDLTDEFTGWAARKPPTMRVRTNEKCFAKVREMREFHYTADAGWKPALMATTPLPVYETAGARENQALGALLAMRGEGMAQGVQAFPTAFKLSPSLQARYGGLHVLPLVGGSCQVPETTPAFRWQFPNLRNESVRQKFSLQTCNGCHAGETNCSDGLHIKPRNEKEVAKVSAFLQPSQLQSIKSPDGSQETHLSELADRINILTAFLQEDSAQQRSLIAEMARRRARLAH